MKQNDDVRQKDKLDENVNENAEVDLNEVDADGTVEDAADSFEDSVELEADRLIGELQEQVAQKDAAYRRALADYQNLQRRTQEDQQRFVKLATAGIIERILEPLDHLEMAAKHMNDKGLGMVVQQFLKVLEEEGVKKIETSGKSFDHETMEAIDTADGEKDQVVQEQSAGYMMNGYVLRTAKVVVGSGAVKNEQLNEQNSVKNNQNETEK
jgi:molecular chaperone GrpE